MTWPEPLRSRDEVGEESSGDPTTSRDLGDAILRALDHAGVGITVLLIDEEPPHRCYTNRAFADMLHCSVDDLMRLRPFDALTKEEATRLIELLEKSRSTGPTTHRIQTVLTRKSGSRIPVDIAIVSTHCGRRPAWVVFFHDISERTRVAAALRESEARFRQLAEAAPDGIAVTCEGRFAYANPALARLHGFDSPDEMRGLSPDSLVVAEQGAELRARVAKLEQREMVPPTEWRAYRKDRSTFAMEVSSIPIDFGGKPAVLSFVRDIDRRKLMETELAQADRLAAVGTLAAGVAHEVNNPLTYLLLNLRKLRQSLPEMACEPSQRTRAEKLLDEALDGGERVRVIVRDLLTFARSDGAGRKRVDAAVVMDSTVKLARTGLRSARVVRDFEPTPPVHGSEARLGQVFLNLLMNAAQAFEGADSDANEIRVSIRPAGARILVEVADNGAGIAPEHLGRIFDPFFTTKSPGTGTGLGLSITRSIVESLRGEINLDSEPGRGTRVRVLLPAAR